MDQDSVSNSRTSVVVAKFSVIRHETYEFPTGDPVKTVVLGPQYDPSIPEDVNFSLATPYAELKMGVFNPDALARLPIGASFYVEFFPVQTTQA